MKLAVLILTTSLTFLLLLPSALSHPTLTSDQKAYLKAHNTLRSKKHAQALTWNSTFASYALHLSKTCNFAHSHGPYGENLAAGTHPLSIAQAIKLWTDEEKDYNKKKPVPSHYTQVVWKGSRSVGCAKTFCKDLKGAFNVSRSQLTYVNLSERLMM